MTKGAGKLLAIFLFSFIFILLLNTSLISAGLCKNDRGNYYYCEKYSRYSYTSSNYYSDYYSYDGYYINYYDTRDSYYEANYTKCSDYHYFNDIYDSDAYRHYCMNNEIYNTYLDNFGNIIKVSRPNYRSVVYYDYTNDPLYPDYYKYQVEQQNTQNVKLKPPIIYVN